MKPWMNCLSLSLPAVDLACTGPLDHEVEGPPHLPDRVHAVEDAARSEAVLGGLVALSRLPERVVERHAHVVVDRPRSGRGDRPQIPMPRTMWTPGVSVGTMIWTIWPLSCSAPGR